MQLKLVLQWTATTKKEPTHIDIEFIKNMCISNSKVKKLLGIFATTRFIQDWKVVEPNEVLSRDCTGDYFLKKLQPNCKPTKNPVIRNFKFWQ